MLRPLHKQWRARKYIFAINPRRKEILEEKVLAEELFKDKKASYRASFPEAFEWNRLGESETNI